MGSLYQHFLNKESLVDKLRGTFRAQMPERLSRASEGIAKLALREAVREFIHFVIELHREDPLLHNELAAEISKDQRPIVLDMVRTFLETRRKEIRRRNLENVAYVVAEARG